MNPPSRSEGETASRDLLGTIRGIRVAVRGRSALVTLGAALLAAISTLHLVAIATGREATVSLAEQILLALGAALLVALLRPGRRAGSRAVRSAPGTNGVLATAAWLDGRLARNDEILSAADVARDPDHHGSSLAGLTLRRGLETLRASSRARRLPVCRPSGFLPGLDFAVLVVVASVLLSDGDLRDGRLLLVPVAGGTGTESTAGGAGTSKSDEPGTGGGGAGSRDDPEREPPEAREDPSDPETTNPIPEFLPDPKFVKPLRRPGPDVVKEAVVLEEILARLGQGSDPRPESGAGDPAAGEPLDPEDLAAVFERMKEMDVGRPTLGARDRDLVARYFEEVRKQR